MSFPNIPNVTPSISVTREEVVNLLLASIAFEELGLAHIINAEAEKIQAVIGTLPGVSIPGTTVGTLVEVNKLVNRTLKTVIKKEMLLQFKLEEILENLPPGTSSTSTSSTTTTTTSSTTTTTTTTTTPLLFIFGDIASATGFTAAGNTVEGSDDAFYHSNFAPGLNGYTFTPSSFIGVIQGPNPSIRVVKQVSVDGGVNWEDAPAQPGPLLTPMAGKAWFRIFVLNNGNEILNNVTITDPSLGLVEVLKQPLVNGAGVLIEAKPL